MTRRPFTEFLYRALLGAYPSDFRRTLSVTANSASVWHWVPKPTTSSAWSWVGVYCSRL